MPSFIQRLKDSKPVLLAAPMCGYTRFPFRQILSSFPVDLVFTEMASIDAIHYNNPNTRPILYHEKIGIPAGVQLVGRKIPYFLEAVRKLSPSGLYEVFDINMGCPVKKVLKSGGGSALIENPDLVHQIMTTLTHEFPDLFFSAKIRIGINSLNLNYKEISKAVEEGGAKMLTVHGRTRAQVYSGTVDLEAIRIIKETVKIPVIGNGGIFTPEDAKKMLDETHCDGVMPARGMFGNPWLFREIKEYLTAGQYQKPSLEDKIQTFQKHFFLESHFDPENGYREYKKIGIGYLSGFKKASELRKSLIECKTTEQMKEFVENFSLINHC